MKTLEKVSDFVGKYMAAIVIVVAALALFFPGTFSVVKTAWVNTLLGIVMFGMGLTLKPEDFKVVFSRPKDVIIGCIAQFTLMPFLAWALTQLFHLPTELAIGVILVGTCPGGTSSNVMTYLSKGDVALSVGMTAVSTVLAPFLTPLLTLLYAGQRVDVNPVNMFLSIVKVVLVPIALGFVVNHFFHAFTQNAVRVLPLISTTAIVLMTDGRSNSDHQDEFESAYKSRGRDLPIFSIMFGDADPSQLKSLATLSNAKVFDGRSGDLAAVFRQAKGFN